MATTRLFMWLGESSQNPQKYPTPELSKINWWSNLVYVWHNSRCHEWPLPDAFGGRAAGACMLDLQNHSYHTSRSVLDHLVVQPDENYGKMFCIVPCVMNCHHQT